jgi:hypothetical protein
MNGARRFSPTASASPRTSPARWVALGACALAWTACGQRSADDEFDSFLARANRTPTAVVRPDSPGVVVDLTGRYLFNIDLGGAGIGDVLLPLDFFFDEVTFFDEESEEYAAGVAALVDGSIRFPDDAEGATPIATFNQTEYRTDGTLAIDIGYVRLEPDRSPIQDTAVEVEFVLQALVLSTTEICGLVDDPDSAVAQPIQIPLRGVTFGAKRYGDDGAIPVRVPTECPAAVEVPTDPDADVGLGDDVGPVDPPDGGETDAGPDPDDLIAPEPGRTGQRADITGTWWMSVGVGGGSLNLDFLTEMTYHEDEQGAHVTGAMRITTFPASTPAAATFSVPVDEDGVFRIAVRGLRAPSRLGEVNADVALTGIIDDADFFCGIGAGRTFTPLRLNLEGSTFGAIRVPDGFGQPPFEAGPEGAVNRCRD